MDIKAELKEKLDEIVEKIKSDDKIMEKFQKDPITALEELLEVDLPNDQIKALAEAVKAKLDLDKLGNALGGLGKLFGK